MKKSTGVLFFLSSVLVYSVFPLIGTLVVGGINPVLFVGLSHLFALIALTGVNAMLITRGRLSHLAGASRVIMSHRFLSLAFVSGVVNAASHSSLFGSFMFISSSSGTALYEVWPVAVVVFIERVLPRQYTPLVFRKWLFVAMAIIGVAILVKSATATDMSVSMSSANITIGVSLALLSAALMALSSGLDVVLCRKLDNVAETFIQPMVAQNVVKVFSSIFTLLAYFLFFRSTTVPIPIDSRVMLIAAGTGVFVIAFGAVAYHIGNVLADSAAVNILWYLTPVLSLIWLDAFGVAKITEGIAVGAILIISANLLLTIRADPKTAYAGALCGICLSAFFCNYIRGTTDDHYYDIIVVLTSVLTILAAFLLQRVSDKALRISNTMSELLEAILRSTSFTGRQKKKIVKGILDWVEDRLVRRQHTSARLLDVSHQGADRDIDVLCRKLTTASANVVSFGETLVLVMLSGIALLIIHIARPYSFIGDLLPVVLTAVLIFLSVKIIREEHGDEISPILSIYRDHELEGQDKIPDKENQTPLISIVLLFAIFAIYVMVLLRKYGIPFSFQ